MRTLVALVVGLLTLGGAMSVEAKELPKVEALPQVRELPDPFLFMDGKRVKSRGSWAARRAELKELVQHYAYGTLPPTTGRVKAVEDSSSRLESGATERKLTLAVDPGRKLLVHLVLTVPQGPGPFPTIVDGDLCWGRVAPNIVTEATSRGYALAEFDRTDLAIDENKRTGGLYSLYPEGDFGAISAWAWGFHRVVDYLRTLRFVDSRRIAITGHSRGGKAALLAGALDDRVALVAPNNSGCMGAGCCRFPNQGETVERITSVFPYWFSPTLKQFVKQEDRLPFDQHSLKALVAPRPLLSTEGLEDNWANQPGTQLTYQAAREVYRFLGVPEKIGIVFRPGGHAHSLPDWQSLLDFADWQLLGKQPTRRFDQLHYPDASAGGYTWRAP
ncbi:MAG TPA: acetylxylan esterase [Armatimonadota bacterium]|jgi:hypothetical protein